MPNAETQLGGCPTPHASTLEELDARAAAAAAARERRAARGYMLLLPVVALATVFYGLSSASPIEHTIEDADIPVKCRTNQQCPNADAATQPRAPPRLDRDDPAR